MSHHYEKMANCIRSLTVDAIFKAQSGHLGLPLGMADVATVLATKFLKFNPTDPNWIDRDRFVLSAGHGSMLLYSLLYLLGYDISFDDIVNFRQLDSKAHGHPEYGAIPGIENTSGPLGQGLANAVGMAIAERKLNSQFGNETINHFTYTIVGDGCLMEGISHEACSLAGHLKLNKLVVLFDDNGISIDGSTDLTISDDMTQRFLSYNWNVIEINGHDYTQIEDALTKSRNSDKPTIIRCKTIIGKFLKDREATSKAHGGPPSADEVKNFKKLIEYDTLKPFELDENIVSLWNNIYDSSKYGAWYKNNENQIDKVVNYSCLTDIDDLIMEIKSDILEKKPTQGTRESSGKIIEKIMEKYPCFIGGSADLTTSNNTANNHSITFNKENYNGNYIYYGIREHAMVACMNGIALHGGLRTYGGTFFIFSDYCKPSIRLAALMKLPIILIMTHDSIGVGEDGPTHQPIEQLASFRAMPNLYVFRPADAMEVCESYQIALKINDAPSMLVLSRQKLQYLNFEKTENIANKGAYECYSTDIDISDITIFASGSELKIAIDSAQELEKLNYKVRVISVLCDRLFFEQDQSYCDFIIKDNSQLKIAIEAGSSLGWHRFIGIDGIFIGMKTFGESAPCNVLYEYFGISVGNIVNICCERMDDNK
ncbi:MAG: transketolase [Candidatus Heimdallarchaeota archaeon]|nr:transketolase [Candidatus Heimdallarchaeota archaeon]